MDIDPTNHIFCPEIVRLTNRIEIGLAVRTPHGLEFPAYVATETGWRRMDGTSVDASEVEILDAINAGEIPADVKVGVA